MALQFTASKTDFEFLGLIDFESALNYQKIIHSERVINKKPDTTLGLIHLPCITIGRLGSNSDTLDCNHLPVYYTDRGGKVTYHGEGQLVVYFIWHIKGYGIKGFLDFLEEIIIATLIKLGINKEDFFKSLNARGVWIKNKKIASIGIGIRKWVSYHGISINIDKRIHEGFNKIIPCGMNANEICCLEHFGIKTNAFDVFKILVDLISGNGICKV